MNHCGLFHCPFPQARRLMPELEEAWSSAPMRDDEEYVADVKIHMLMPGQWPCIPGWHRDMVPRDEDLTPQPHLIDPNKVMMMWVSGPPLTEFRDARGGVVTTVRPKEWVEFTQEDEHRGTAAKEHTWRTFIRLVPGPLLEPAPMEQWIRRHTQVYLNAEDFSW